MDHCISALLAEREKQADDMMFRAYVTDCLKVLTENTAKSIMTGMSGNVITNRYVDIVDPKPKEPEKKAEDIVIDIFTRAGLKSKREEVSE